MLIEVTGNAKSKMAAAKPEVLISQLLYQIATKFQRLHPHFWGPPTQQNWCGHCDIEVTGKSKMAAITGSRYEITQYLSFYTRWQHNSKGYTHIFEVRQHGRTSVDTLR